MNEIDLLAVAAWIIVSLFGALTGLLVWLGNRFIHRLDSLVREINESTQGIDGRINKLDRRVTRIETHCADRRRTDNPWPSTTV